jgi:hypothetical protein
MTDRDELLKRDHVREALELIGATARGRRPCPSCGHRLIDPHDDRCRPCGEEHALRVKETRDDWWARKGARNATKLERAKSWLRVQLRRGPVDSRTITDRAAKAGIQPRTLRRAREQLGVDVERRGAAADHRTYWSL